MSFLVGVCYQPSSVPADKELWIDKMDLFLSHKQNPGKVQSSSQGIPTSTPGTTTQVTTRYIQTVSSNISDQPTSNGNKTIDHIASNLDHILAKIVLPCNEISDHDAPYVIVDIRKQRFVPRFKYITRENNIDISAFKRDI